jgi:bifunctional UDP-N-acetylglucosamine pyrophosphorylase/glucosamine-1-phosphate N-acetyltransferase
MIYSIILAAGKGTRMNSHLTNQNKTSLMFNGKTIIEHGVCLMEQVTDRVFVVVGAYSQSIKDALSSKKVVYIEQPEQLGTGHALQIAVETLTKDYPAPTELVVGYGDHLMFYKPETIKQLINKHQQEKAVITLATTITDKAEELRWGRIVRDEAGLVQKIVEHKDASVEEHLIKEVNPGFYCFNYSFVLENKDSLTLSPVTQEYYLTEFIEIATRQKLKVLPFPVPFNEVGIGVNSLFELEESQQLYRQLRSKSEKDD